MKTPQNEARLSRWQTIANSVGAFALAAVAVSILSYVTVLWNPSHYGDVGLVVGSFALPADNNSWLVTSLVPGYPAAKAGIKVGDRIDASMSWRDQMILTGQVAPHPGEEVTVQVMRGGERRALTLKARPLASLSAADGILLALQIAADAVFLVVGLALVLLRPSRMTWGFYLLAVMIGGVNTPHSTVYPISYLPTSWLRVLGLVEDVIAAAGVVGFLVFCLRFPANSPTGWRRLIDRFCPLLAGVLAAVFVSEDLGTQLILPAEVTRHLWNVWLASMITIPILGDVVLLSAYFSSRGPEQYKIKWVVFGLLCTAIAIVAILLSWGGPLSGLPGLFVGALGVLVVVFPLTVAYAVIRHRVIDVRFVISRSLTVGTIVAILALIVIALDWLFAAMLPTTRFETAVYFGVAIFIGLSLNSGRQRISKTIDALFFRQWSLSQKQASGIADVIRHSTSKADLYEPLTAGIKGAFSLTSVALFERVEDGGFVRVAAAGWSVGTIWHILPNDPLIKRAYNRVRAVDIDSLQWGASDMPSGFARPVAMVPMVAGRQVLAILLLGAHENGTALAQDELRLILRLVEDACPVFAMASAEVVRGGAAAVRVAGT
jgi:hypothetical protein